MQRERRRRRLFRQLMLVIASVVVLLIAITYGYLVQVRRAQFNEQMVALTENIQDDVIRLFQRAERILQVVQTVDQQGLLMLDNPENLRSQLIPMLAQDSIISGMILANAKGNFYYLYPANGDWVSKQSLNDSTIVIRQWHPNQAMDSTWTEPEKIDITDREWYQEAVASLNIDTINWTNPYELHTLKEIGLSGSVSWVNGQDTLVAAIDILITDMIKAISDFGGQQDDYVFLINEQGLPIVSTSILSTGMVSGDQKQVDPIISQALTGWVPDTASVHTGSFKAGNETYWYAFHPLEDRRQTVWLAVVTPEHNFIETVFAKRWVIAGITSLILLFGGLVVWYIIKRNDPAPGIFDHTNVHESIQKLMLDGEGPQIEFKSTVRVNLHTNEIDKAIELAWLKSIAAFLNTHGGVLLIGVNDDGQILGLEADRFPNHDKCLLHVKNLLTRHFDQHHMSAIRFGIATINNRGIVYLQVEPTSEPAYLLDKNKEESFYVRNGPSSDRLPVSKVVQYLQTREVD